MAAHFISSSNTNLQLLPSSPFLCVNVSADSWSETMANHPQESPIQSILFCRFDAKLGPIIVHQVRITSSLCHFSLTIVSGPQRIHFTGCFQFFGRIHNSETWTRRQTHHRVSVRKATLYPLTTFHLNRNSLGHKVLGFPIAIDDTQYDRNRYIFNLCFVCLASKRTVQYEPLIKKLAKYMVQLEQECKFLSRPDNSEDLISVLTDIKNQLNKNRSCKLKISM